jgi:hypothetical protein
MLASDSGAAWSIPSILRTILMATIATVGRPLFFGHTVSPGQ